MPSIQVTRKDLTDWNEYYTIEWYDDRKEFWEIVWFESKAFGLRKSIQEFEKRAVNNDGQYRLTIPA